MKIVGEATAVGEALLDMLQWYALVSAVADGCTGGDWAAAERLLLERADEIVEWLKNEG